MAVTFYNVKKRKKVNVPEAKVKKEKYTSKTKTGKTLTRYAFKSVDDDGTKLTKFCSEADWKAL